MSTFKVTIAAPATASKTITIEAENESEAVSKAEVQGHRYGWIPWDLCNKPLPGSPIIVTEVEEAP